MNNILIIAPIFGEYYRIIKKTVEEKGSYNRVFFMSECPLYSVGLYATITNLFPSLKSFLYRFHNKKIRCLVKNNRIRTIFIIRGEYIDSQTIANIKDGNVKVVVYQWDSIQNNPNAASLMTVADNFYTFDPIDAKNNNVQYLPLFYCWNEVGFKLNTTSRSIDVFSVGGYRPHRMPYIYAMRNYCIKRGLSCYLRSFERFGSFIKNWHRLKMNKNDITFFKLSYKKYYELLCRSKCVLDIPSPSQNGLTMRTMEALSLNKKLVTTNQNILNERFYDRSNIFVVSSPNDLESNKFEKFLQTPAVSIKGLISLTEWLQYMELL